MCVRLLDFPSESLTAPNCYASFERAFLGKSRGF